MILIDDAFEFRMFVNAAWENSRIGNVFLLMPKRGVKHQVEWVLDLLITVKEYDPGTGDCSQYAYQLRSGQWLPDSWDEGLVVGDGVVLYQASV